MRLLYLCYSTIYIFIYIDNISKLKHNIFEFNNASKNQDLYSKLFQFKFEI